jgi:tetratricopeptide (TPR) repeat protein/Zn-dependent protease
MVSLSPGPLTRRPAQAAFRERFMPFLFSGSLRLFRFAGISVFIHWSWFVVAAIQLFSPIFQHTSPIWNVAEYLTLFGIVLAHEFGHAFACRSVGGAADRIVLWPLGGVALVAPPPRPGPHLWTAVAGPLVNVVLLPVTLVLAIAVSQGGDPASSDVAQFAGAVFFMNAGLLVFNLLPIYPMDGGQILHAALWFALGRGRSLVAASVIGLVFAALLAPMAVVIGLGFGALLAPAEAAWGGLWGAVIAAFIGLQAWMGFQRGRQLIRLQPGLDLLDRGVGHLKRGAHAEAAADFGAAAEYFHNEPSLRATALVRRGAALVAKGDYHAAVADYSDALDVGEHPIPYLARGEAHLLRGDPDRAAGDAAEALRLDPNNPAAYVLRGDARVRQERFDEAAADYTHALELDPRPAEVYVRRGGCHTAEGRYDSAVIDYTEAVRLQPDAVDAYNARAIAHRKAGNLDAALADYDAALRRAPGAPPLYYNRGITHSRRGDYPRAIADYTEALRLNPDYAAAHNNLANLLATCPSADVRDGRRAVEHATTACERTAWTNANCLDTLAAASAEVGDFAAALKWQERAMEDPAFARSQGDAARLRLRLYREDKPYRQEWAKLAPGEAGAPATTPTAKIQGREVETFRIP